MGVVCSSNNVMLNIEEDAALIPKDEISLDKTKIIKIQTGVISNKNINSGFLGK